MCLFLHSCVVLSLARCTSPLSFLLPQRASSLQILPLKSFLPPRPPLGRLVLNVLVHADAPAPGGLNHGMTTRAPAQLTPAATSHPKRVAAYNRSAKRAERRAAGEQWVSNAASRTSMKCCWKQALNAHCGCEGPSKEKTPNGCLMRCMYRMWVEPAPPS